MSIEDIINSTESLSLNGVVFINTIILFRRNLGYAVWVLINRTEYNRLTELSDRASYYGKLISQYGFNARTGDWNSKLFPDTQTKHI